MTQPAAPSPPFEAQWIYTAEVDIAERVDLGEGPLGQRWRVDILGGRFEGPRLRGRVLPGGADRQLLRADGVRELDARYDMVCDDGTPLVVHNQVIVDEQPGQPRYARCVLRVQAPRGPHDWLNRRVLVGTLHSLRPARAAVVITVYAI